MTRYLDRSMNEQNLIAKAYDFEIRFAEIGSSARNPYYDDLMMLLDGAEIWEHINTALEMRFQTLV